MKRVFYEPHKNNHRNHGIQQGRCEAKWMNPKLGWQWASLDAGWKNFINQWSESNSSVRKPLLLIFKSDVYWFGKNKKPNNERLPWLIQTVLPFMQVNKGHILLRLELWLQCSENQLQSPNPTYFYAKTLLT